MDFYLKLVLNIIKIPFYPCPPPPVSNESGVAEAVGWNGCYHLMPSLSPLMVRWVLTCTKHWRIWQVMSQQRKIHKAQRLNVTVTPFWYQRSQEEEHGNYRLLFYSEMTMRVRAMWLHWYSDMYRDMKWKC